MDIPIPLRVCQRNGPTAARAGAIIHQMLCGHPHLVVPTKSPGDIRSMPS